VVKKLFLYTCTPATGVKRKRADDDEDDKENEDGSVAAENSGSTPV